MPGGISFAEAWQHVIVTIVALGALAIVLRKVIGVFGGASPSAPASGPTGASSAAPNCGHCAAGTAATSRLLNPSGTLGISPRAGAARPRSAIKPNDVDRARADRVREEGAWGMGRPAWRA